MSAIRRAKKLNAMLWHRKWEDQAHRCQNHCRGWIAHIDNRWKIGGYIQLPRRCTKLQHHNLHQITLDL